MAMTTSTAIKLLKGPAPSNCFSELIDFTKHDLPEYAHSFAMVIHNLLTPGECAAFLDAARATTADQWEQAMVNVGNGRQMLYTDVRNCSRIIWDDETMAERLLDRIVPHLPEHITRLENNARITGYGPVKRQEVWKLSRINERLRFLKYTAGMYFRQHCDGSYVTPDGSEISFMTIHLYLNGDVVARTAPNVDEIRAARKSGKRDELPLEGGATRFFSDNMKKHVDILPAQGSCLV